MKKVVVTGANGFLGSALCKALSSEGIKIIAVVRSEHSDTASIENLPNLKIICCDLSQLKTLSELTDDVDIDVFYHLAWEGSAGDLRGNRNVQIENIKYACDAVQVCFDMGCKRFVFPSSIMEYEIQATMATEMTPGINTLYSSAKMAADYMVRAVAGSLGVDYIRALISNIYGPGEKSARLINTSLRKMLKGEHCSFSAGNQIYDFIYIADAAQAFVEIARKGKNNRTYYIGSRNPKSLKEFLHEMRDAVDTSIILGIGEIPFDGVSLSYKEFDINAVKNDTGFVPKVPFREGIKGTYLWIKEMG